MQRRPIRIITDQEGQHAGASTSRTNSTTAVTLRYWQRWQNTADEYCKSRCNQVQSDSSWNSRGSPWRQSDLNKEKNTKRQKWEHPPQYMLNQMSEIKPATNWNSWVTGERQRRGAEHRTDPGPGSKWSSQWIWEMGKQGCVRAAFLNLWVVDLVWLGCGFRGKF